jgi:hypothetical protein
MTRRKSIVFLLLARGKEKSVEMPLTAKLGTFVSESLAGGQNHPDPCCMMDQAPMRVSRSPTADWLAEILPPRFAMPD